MCIQKMYQSTVDTEIEGYKTWKKQISAASVCYVILLAKFCLQMEKFFW